ncbi:MAG: hydrolase [Planctomycetales bacterium]|nr:hydrolase [Planctomycetales bacterium]
MDEALQWLDGQIYENQRDLIQLANQNSASDNLDGLHRVSSWLQDWLGFEEATFESLPLPARASIDDFGVSAIVEGGRALRWDCRPKASRRVLFAIHYDTVFPIDSPFQSCQKVAENRLLGPGVADAKGGIVVIRNALRALEKFHLSENCGWTILLNPDEEIGSPHSNELLRSMAPDFDFGLLFEPALPSGQLVCQRKGSGNYAVMVTGVAAHAGRHFEEGRNAITELSRLVNRLDELNGCRPGCTINVGSFRGGGPVNVVPDRAMARFNVRLVDDESIKWFDQKLADLAMSVNEKDGYSCKCFGGITSPPKVPGRAMQRLMEHVETSSLALGLGNVEWVSTGGVCDGNKLASAGLPNVDTMGPIGGGLHSEDEWVDLLSIIEKSKLVVDIMKSYAASDLRFRDYLD